jgi:hypothetical protein
MEGSKGRIDSIVEFRGNFLELLIVAIAIALAVHTFGGILESALPSYLSIVVAAVLIVLGCVILIVRAVPRVNRTISLKGIVPIAHADKKVIPIHRYHFSEEMRKILKATFHENKALEKLWLNSLSALKSLNDSGLDTSGFKLINEAIEYFILEQLSLDLSAYFINNPDIENGAVVSLLRKDMPSVLLNNRFLDLLSRPMEERDVFSSYMDKTTKNRGEAFAITRGASDPETVYVITEDGALFDHFDLVLPRGTTVSRGDGQSFSIKTKRFLLRFRVEFSGFRTNFPEDFEELYLGCKFDDVTPYIAHIYIDVKFKLLSVLSQRGWEYFKWIDIFLTNLQDEFSFDSFLSRIGWEIAYSVARLEKQAKG